MTTIPCVLLIRVRIRGKTEFSASSDNTEWYLFSECHYDRIVWWILAFHIFIVHSFLTVITIVFLVRSWTKLYVGKLTRNLLKHKCLFRHNSTIHFFISFFRASRYLQFCYNNNFSRFIQFNKHANCLGKALKFTTSKVQKQGSPDSPICDQIASALYFKVNLILSYILIKMCGLVWKETIAEVVVVDTGLGWTLGLVRSKSAGSRAVRPIHFGCIQEARHKKVKLFVQFAQRQNRGTFCGISTGSWTETKPWNFLWKFQRKFHRDWTLECPLEAVDKQSIRLIQAINNNSQHFISCLTYLCISYLRIWNSVMNHY